MAIRFYLGKPGDGMSLKALDLPSDVREYLASRSTLPFWLFQLLAKKAEARRVAESAAAYRVASGGRAASPAAQRGRTARPPVASSSFKTLDEVNAALSDAVDASFLASRSEAAFCQAGVVAPPDSPDLGNSSDLGEGF